MTGDGASDQDLPREGRAGGRARLGRSRVGGSGRRPTQGRAGAPGEPPGHRDGRSRRGPTWSSTSREPRAASGTGSAASCRSARSACGWCGRPSNCLGVYAEVRHAGPGKPRRRRRGARIGSSRPSTRVCRGLHRTQESAVSAQITVTVAGSERSVPAGTTAGELFADEQRGAQAVVVAAGRRRAARPGPRAGRRRRRRAGRPGLARRPRGAAALGGPRAGPGRAAGQPGGPARHRAAGPRRLLLRLRRRGSVHPRGPEGAREGHAADRQREPDLPAPGRDRGRGPGRAGRRALQARADRPQGRPRRHRESSRPSRAPTRRSEPAS